MNTTKKILKELTIIFRNVYSNLPLPGISRPVFIIGCGRSGTTILGKSLSKHKEITYLNEPRDLWFSAYPETDIWTSAAHLRNGKLALTEVDSDTRKSKKLSRLFRFMTIINNRHVLIEKLPINSFRLKFIQNIFPDARYIHIYRNGLEVARSINKACDREEWFGKNYYKWDLLVKYSKNKKETKNLPEICTTSYEKGLLEWRLSTESAVNFLCNISDDAYIEVNYDEFINDPIKTITRIINFIDIAPDLDVENFVSNT